jgi:hypothetical protein
MATHGRHRFFTDEQQIFDVRRKPIRFAGYSIGFRQGGDGEWHASVRIDETEFRVLKAQFLSVALKCSAEALAMKFIALPFVPYAPVRAQMLSLLHIVNRIRRKAGLERLSEGILPESRRVVKPFG